MAGSTLDFQGAHSRSGFAIPPKRYGRVYKTRHAGCLYPVRSGCLVQRLRGLSVGLCLKRKGRRLG